MMESRILPECHADTLLTELATGYKVNHQPNINEVAKTMINHFKNRLAIGIVDDDKRKPDYFKAFTELNREGGFILKKHPERQHYLIVLAPAFEQWVFNAAKACDIDHTKYKITDIKHFKKLTKSIRVDKNTDVKNFLNAIKQKPDNPINQIKQRIENILNG